MFWHELVYWRPAPNAQGACQARKVIGSSATTADEAARERCKIAAEHDSRSIITLTTHTTGE